jgi:excisionase family DNA binding protein
MLNQPGGITAQATAPVAAGGAHSQGAGAQASVPETLGPADAAKLLGVTEADVVASLEKGDLKGKRIGSQWRLTRTQLADFLQS